MMAAAYYSSMLALVLAALVVPCITDGEEVRDFTAAALPVGFAPDKDEGSVFPNVPVGLPDENNEKPFPSVQANSTALSSKDNSTKNEAEVSVTNPTIAPRATQDFMDYSTSESHSIKDAKASPSDSVTAAGDAVEDSDLNDSENGEMFSKYPFLDRFTTADDERHSTLGEASKDSFKHSTPDLQEETTFSPQSVSQDSISEDLFTQGVSLPQKYPADQSDFVRDTKSDLMRTTASATNSGSNIGFFSTPEKEFSESDLESEKDMRSDSTDLFSSTRGHFVEEHSDSPYRDPLTRSMDHQKDVTDPQMSSMDYETAHFTNHPVTHSPNGRDFTSAGHEDFERSDYPYSTQPQPSSYQTEFVNFLESHFSNSRPETTTYFDDDSSTHGRLPTVGTQLHVTEDRGPTPELHSFTPTSFYETTIAEETSVPDAMPFDPASSAMPHGATNSTPHGDVVHTSEADGAIMTSREDPMHTSGAPQVTGSEHLTSDEHPVTHSVHEGEDELHSMIQTTQEADHEPAMTTASLETEHHPAMEATTQSESSIAEQQPTSHSPTDHTAATTASAEHTENHIITTRSATQITDDTQRLSDTTTPDVRTTERPMETAMPTSRTDETKDEHFMTTEAQDAPGQQPTMSTQEHELQEMTSDAPGDHPTHAATTMNIVREEGDQSTDLATTTRLLQSGEVVHDFTESIRPNESATVHADVYSTESKKKKVPTATLR